MYYILDNYLSDQVEIIKSFPFERKAAFGLSLIYRQGK